MKTKYFAIHDPNDDLAHCLDTVVNLQRGIPKGDLEGHDQFDIALAAQIIAEERITAYAKYAKFLTNSKNLVFMGGVALNCVANPGLFKLFENIHIMPNPGDAGSSLGAAAMEWFEQTGQKVNWRVPYLGHEIVGKYPVEKAMESLRKNEIFGIANGRAEYGPRALGNRSLMADPRGGDIKDRMNEIKHRQKFRPFAPVILAEYADEYFEMPKPGIQSPYMQFVAKCKFPDEFPAIIHADGTSRVQTVNYAQHPGLYTLLKKFYERTGCPMLVNTSLNIKGMPIVNNEADAIQFAHHYNVEVHLRDDQ